MTSFGAEDYAINSLRSELADARLRAHEDENIDASLDSAFIKPEFRSFLDEGQWKLHLRSYYFERDTEANSDNQALVAGGWLSWQSGYWEDVFQIGLTYEHSQKMYGPEDKDGTGLLQEGQQSYGSLSEIYADVHFSELKLSVGRFAFNSPYINKNDIRQTPNIFQAVRGIYQASDQLTVGAAYVSHMKDRTSTNFESMYKQAGIDDSRGVVGMGARYAFSPNDSIGFFAYIAPDFINTYYSEAKKRIEINDKESLDFSLQHTYQNSVGDELGGDINASHYGFKTKWNRNFISPHAALTYYSNTDQLLNPWGATPNYTFVIVNEFDRPGEKAALVGFTADGAYLGLDGWSSFVNYVHGDTPDGSMNGSPDQTELDLTLDYHFPKGAFEGLWLRWRYANVNRSDSDRADGNDVVDIRMIINYECEF